MSPTPLRPLLAAAVVAVASACSGRATPDPSPAPPDGGAAPIVQPGAPGEAGRSVDPGELPEMAGAGYTEADVAFMQGMIPHHAQALQMTALVPDRTSDEGFRRMALRMEISQRDEIELMSRWLETRAEEVPRSAHVAHGHRAGEMPRMPGMLTPDQMARLEASEGSDFERLFLEYMIQHHQGALTMVDRLFATPGGGQETALFRFASDVDADQGIEIRRMGEMLEARGGPVPNP